MNDQLCFKMNEGTVNLEGWGGDGGRRHEFGKVSLFFLLYVVTCMRERK